MRRASDSGERSAGSEAAKIGNSLTRRDRIAPMRLRISLVLAVGASLALVANATGTAPSGTKVKQLHAPILALTLRGSRVAYFRGCRFVTRKGVTNPLDKVMVWNTRTGRTFDVSGKQTHHLDLGGGSLQVAMNGSEVAWTTQRGSNSTSEDRLFVSSLAKPKEHLVAKDDRPGDCESPEPGCAGTWTGGLVSTGKRILFNQWTTDNANSMHNASLLALDGKTPKDVADGSATVLAVSADATHVAVLRASGTVGLYSPAGKSLLNVSPPSARAVAVGGRNLVILENDGTLAVYDSGTGSIRKTFHLQGNRKNLQALAVTATSRSTRSPCASRPVRSARVPSTRSTSRPARTVSWAGSAARSPWRASTPPASCTQATSTALSRAAAPSSSCPSPRSQPPSPEHRSFAKRGRRLLRPLPHSTARAYLRRGRASVAAPFSGARPLNTKTFAPAIRFVRSRRRIYEIQTTPPRVVERAPTGTATQVLQRAVPLLAGGDRHGHSGRPHHPARGNHPSLRRTGLQCGHAPRSQGRDRSRAGNRRNGRRDGGMRRRQHQRRAPARPGRGRRDEDAERGCGARAPEPGGQRPGTTARDARCRRDRRHEFPAELQARLDGGAAGPAARARQDQGDRARAGRRLRHLPEARLPLVPAARRQAVDQARPHEARQVGRPRSRAADVRQPAPAQRSPRDARGRGSQGAEGRPGDHRRRRHDALPRQDRPGQGAAGEGADQPDAQGDRRAG